MSDRPNKDGGDKPVAIKMTMASMLWWALASLIVGVGFGLLSSAISEMTHDHEGEETRTHIESKFN